eukprot:4936302-Prymnesium_polylepis.2
MPPLNLLSDTYMFNFTQVRTLQTPTQMELMEVRLYGADATTPLAISSATLSSSPAVSPPWVYAIEITSTRAGMGGNYLYFPHLSEVQFFNETGGQITMESASEINADFRNWTLTESPNNLIDGAFENKWNSTTSTRSACTKPLGSPETIDVANQCVMLHFNISSAAYDVPPLVHSYRLWTSASNPAERDPTSWNLHAFRSGLVGVAGAEPYQLLASESVTPTTCRSSDYSVTSCGGATGAAYPTVWGQGAARAIDGCVNSCPGWLVGDFEAVGYATLVLSLPSPQVAAGYGLMTSSGLPQRDP